jgi:hypothetical protein
MTVSGCYWNSKWAGASNETETATWDYEIPPSTIFATSTLSTVIMSNQGFAGSGILEYRKRNQKTGIDKVITVGSFSGLLTQDLASAIWDSNVDSVTFAMMVWDTGAGAPESTGANVVQQMWVIS